MTCRTARDLVNASTRLRLQTAAVLLAGAVFSLEVSFRGRRAKVGSDAVNSTTMCSALRRITQSEFEQYRLSTYELLEEQRVQIVDRKRKAESAALMLEAEKAKNKKLEADNTRLKGVAIGKDRNISDLTLATYQALKKKSPPGSGSAVCWKTFGELSMSEMTTLGLKPNDWVASTSWNDGFWISEPPVPDPNESVPDCPPFVATHTWEKTVNQHGEDTYRLRTEDETKPFLRSMPTSYTGPPRYGTKEYSADFYWYLKNNYSSKKADALLGYLLEKYKEYEQHAGTLGSSGYGFIVKPWNEAADQEMTLIEMINKLADL